MELIKFDVKKFHVGDSWVYFSTDDGVVFCSRVVKEDYYDVDEYFKFDGTRLRLPKALKDSVDTVHILAEGDFDIDKRIDVKIGDGKISCRGERSIGWIESELDIKFSKEEAIEFAINPIFFSQILDKSTTMTIGEDRALFLSGSFKHLISLYQK
ncbi:MAG: hypothetical protein KKF15_13865 [Alphaproteobacteria bacterium]|nr:hypothetical protein [Alphaproteobacteria bacterium]MBU1794585.1 hypothetical protein [Alphaproteobacteria bacterium]